MERRPATADEARALSNPLRLRILRLCLDRALTNEELAARLGLNAGTVLHHVRLLVRTGFLAAEGERRGARGSIERPYRATGKSWTLDVGEEEGTGKTSTGTLALIDAFRAEVAEASPQAIMNTSRLGVRLTAPQLAAFGERIMSLVNDLKEADDPAGEPYGFLVGMHRRAE
ncbi:MAG TPA: helix-turn-helix domain-containing protein [Candidatus Limnocylindrales bacterium]|nr:helix-turn-helix domain-containing protein [Candidatus Limnocylindrales bacterium]